MAAFTGGGTHASSRASTAPTSPASVGANAAAGVAAENRALTAELLEAAEVRQELKVRLQGLGTESKRQEETCSTIEGKLAASRARRRALLRRLQSLGKTADVQEDEEGIDIDEPASLAEDNAFSRDQSLSLDGISLANSSALGVDVPPSPSSARFYELRNGAYESRSPAEAMESSEIADGGFQVDDLEFAYDWGLGLAGKMSIGGAGGETPEWHGLA